MKDTNSEITIRLDSDEIASAIAGKIMGTVVRAKRLSFKGECKANADYVINSDDNFFDCDNCNADCNIREQIEEGDHIEEGDQIREDSYSFNGLKYVIEQKIKYQCADMIETVVGKMMREEAGSQIKEAVSKKIEGIIYDEIKIPIPYKAGEEQTISEYICTEVKSYLHKTRDSNGYSFKKGSSRIEHEIKTLIEYEAEQFAKKAKDQMTKHIREKLEEEFGEKVKSMQENIANTIKTNLNRLFELR